jgi:signal peptidase I
MVENQVVSWTFRAQPQRVAHRYMLLGGALLLAAVLSPLKLGIVRGESMSPSLQSGAMYVMDRGYFRSHTVKRDEILVFKHNGVSYIKRVLAAPGDMVYVLRHRGSDQDELVGDWQLPGIRRAVQRRPWKTSMQLVPVRLQKDQYYVIGDNVADSIDSRSFGPIRKDQIQGRVLFAPPSVPDLQHFAGNFQSERRRS